MQSYDIVRNSAVPKLYDFKGLNTKTNKMNSVLTVHNFQRQAHLRLRCPLLNGNKVCNRETHNYM